MDIEPKLIPFKLYELLIKNNNYRSIEDKLASVNMRNSTRQALMMIKQQNKLRTMSDVVDMLIAAVGMQQYKDPKYAKEIGEMANKDLRIIENGTKRAVVIMGKKFKSMKDAARHFNISIHTVRNRITDVVNMKYMGWNFEHEDTTVKYMNSTWNIKKKKNG